MEKILSAILCGIVSAGILAMWLFPPAPYAAVLFENAALLYYNSPSAVQTPEGIAVGVITASGSVEVALVGESMQKTTIHQYEGVDDHAAPALWWTGEELLIATAFHGSDLFIYSLNLGGRPTLKCHWEGRFTYPRFTLRDGDLHLLARHQREANAGDLVTFFVSNECNSESVIVRANENQIIYAAAPVDESLVWSVYDLHQHNGIWLDGKEQSLALDPEHNQTLAWSSVGDLVSVSRFSTNLGQPGTYKAEIYRRQSLLHEWPATPTRYYPSGVVLTDDGVALAPRGDSLARFDLERITPLPSCATRGFASRGQFVSGGSGAYVFVEHRGSYNPKKLIGSRVLLCDY